MVNHAVSYKFIHSVFSRTISYSCLSLLHPLIDDDSQIAGENMSADPVTPPNITEMKPDGK